jgi:putative acetyltransferase
MTIRREHQGDETGIHAVHVGAFPTEAEARLVGQLRAAGRLSISLVADIGGEIVGHVAFSPVSAGTGSGTSGLGLAPVAVLPHHQRHGIGSRLILEGLAAARRLGAGFVVVLGEPAYYGRFGFRPAAEWGLHDEYGGGPAFQVIELRPSAIPRNAGLVRYAPEFAAFA